MKALELYCGAGGSLLGAANAGVSEVLAIDLDAEKLRSIALNESIFKACGCSVSTRQANILDLDLKDIPPDVELVIGGAPCQPFSLSGKRLGFDDPRNGISRFFSFVSGLEPEAFLLENVPGLLHGRFVHELSVCIANTFSTSVGDVFDWLVAAGGKPSTIRLGDYDLHAAILNAADFGVAQERRRLFVFGHRRMSGFAWAWPETTHSRNNLLEDLDLLDSNYFSDHGIRKVFFPKKRGGNLICRDGLQRWRTVRDVFKQLGPPFNRPPDLAVFGHYLRKGARQYHGHTGSYPDWPAKTLKAGVNGVPGGENMVRWPNGKVRYFTMQECAVLQGFPLSYFFEGNFKSAINSIGNAVPPILVERIIGSYLVESKRHISAISKQLKITRFPRISPRLTRSDEASSKLA